MLKVYEETLLAAGRQPRPLTLTLHNDIPIGMGCGSSAAARLAGLTLANHFGELGWTCDHIGDRILDQACRLEGHPDNAAACWLGGFTVAAEASDPEKETLKNGDPRKRVSAVSIDPPAGWTAILVLPKLPLATSAARAVLPVNYSLADAVTNVQNVALLTAAFHTGRADVLKQAMADQLHQPYRAAVCPLLPLLLPMAGQDGILGIALSGAGPAVLALVQKSDVLAAMNCLRRALPAALGAEMLQVPLARRLFRESHRD